MTGREPYVGFLAGLMPQLQGYGMDVARVTYVDDGRRAFAELRETVTLNGTPTVTDEVLAFDLDGEGRVSRVAIHLRQAR